MNQIIKFEDKDIHLVDFPMVIKLFTGANANMQPEEQTLSDLARLIDNNTQEYKSLVDVYKEVELIYNKFIKDNQWYDQHEDYRTSLDKLKKIVLDRRLARKAEAIPQPTIDEIVSIPEPTIDQMAGMDDVYDVLEANKSLLPGTEIAKLTDVQKKRIYDELKTIKGSKSNEIESIKDHIASLNKELGLKLDLSDAAYLLYDSDLAKQDPEKRKAA